MSFYSPVVTNAAGVKSSDKLHLFKHVETEDQPQAKAFESRGGYTAWRKVLSSMKPEEVIAEVKASGLRGRRWGSRSSRSSR